MFNNNYLCQVMLQPNQRLEGQDHADQLSMNRPYEDSYNVSPPRNETGQDQLPTNRPHDDFEDLFPPRNEMGQDSNVKQDDVSNTPQLYPDPAADPAPTCTEPFSNFSDYLSNLSN